MCVRWECGVCVTVEGVAESRGCVRWECVRVEGVTESRGSV